MFKFLKSISEKRLNNPRGEVFSSVKNKNFLNIPNFSFSKRFFDKKVKIKDYLSTEKEQFKNNLDDKKSKFKNNIEEQEWSYTSNNIK